MKNLLLLSIYLLLSTSAFSQVVKIGETIPDFQVPLLGGEKQNLSRSQLNNKIFILDFWATWCSPCIASMEHLDELKNAFPDELIVMTVSSEEKSRIEKFIQNKKELNILFGVDSEGQLNEFFPHRTIPHTVLINQKGEVLAITRPGYITKDIIGEVLETGTVELPTKVDNVTFDYSADYFQADTNTLEAFIVESAIPNVTTFSKAPNNGPFANRRISMHNFPIDAVYRTAYQTSAYRMVYEMDEAAFDYDKDENKYCIDIIVKPENAKELYPTLLKKAKEHFDVKARLEKREMDVVAIYRPDSLQNKLEKSTTPKRAGAGGDHFKSGGAQFKDFADYLEGFGIVGMPVVDATGDAQLYDFDFQFEPENPKTFHAAVKEMGLKLKKEKRAIEVLVIYE